jgi:hypothetical protein
MHTTAAHKAFSFSPPPLPLPLVLFVVAESPPRAAEPAASQTTMTKRAFRPSKQSEKRRQNTLSALAKSLRDTRLESARATPGPKAAREMLPALLLSTIASNTCSNNERDDQGWPNTRDGILQREDWNEKVDSERQFHDFTLSFSSG